MNKTFLKIAIAAMVLSLYTCGKDKKEPTPPVLTEAKEVVASDINLNTTDTRSDVVFANDTIDNLYNQYLMIKKGLVNADYKIVQEESKKLEILLKDTEGNKQLKATAKLISLTKDVTKQRNFFVTLTVETEKLIRNAAITSGEVYKQFCPMAFEGNGGYWLSDSKEVRNPYYGNMMLKCGTVHETIK